ERIPPPKQRTKVVPAMFVVAAIEKRSRKPVDHPPASLLFFKRPEQGLWGGLWELPSEPLEPGASVEHGLARLKPTLPAGCQLSQEPIGQVTRQLTHRHVTFHMFTGSAAKSSKLPNHRGHPSRWIARDEITSIGVSRACEAVLKLLGW